MLNNHFKLPITVLLAALLGTSLVALADEELSGRLFTTAAERARLDQLRLKKSDHPTEAIASDPAGESNDGPIIDQATLDGYVTRSSGNNTAWVNQKALSESQPANVAPGLRVVQRPGQAAQISMQTHDGKRVSVKVGETLDRVTGKVEKVVDTSAKPPELIPN